MEITSKCINKFLKSCNALKIFFLLRPVGKNDGVASLLLGFQKGLRQNQAGVNRLRTSNNISYWKQDNLQLLIYI